MASPQRHRAARFDETDDDETWQPVGTPAVVGVLAFALAALWFGNRGDRWFPLLDGANLLFHEFGHPFFGLISARLAVYGGTLAQFIFPLAAAFKFRRMRATCSFVVCAIWLFQNLFGIARYMADARSKVLPLIGGKDPEDAHDWAEILSRWGLLQADTRLAGALTAIGWLGILLSCGWLVWRWLQDRSRAAAAAPSRQRSQQR